MAHDPDIEFATSARKINKHLDRLLPRAEGPESLLADAMRHALLDQKQRLHGYLVCAAAELFAVDPYRAMRTVAAVECAFSYSRIHDDLPCMDNVDHRYGRPTVHVEFDEATAILAGDALLALSFELLADKETHQDPSIRCGLVAGLSAAAGGHGVAGGQIHELFPESKYAGIGEVTRLQQMKSGALIVFSCESGGMLGHAFETAHHALRAFAHDLGLAYQIVTEIRSAENISTTEKSNLKYSFVSVLGLERARTQAKFLAVQSRQHIDIFDNNTNSLNHAVDFVSHLCD